MRERFLSRLPPETQAHLAQTRALTDAFYAQLTPVAAEAMRAQLAEIKESGQKVVDVLGQTFYTLDPAAVNKALDPQSTVAAKTNKTIGIAAIGGAAIVLFLLMRG